MTAPHVLVVDDDQFFRTLIRGDLQAAGYEVTVASDVSTARHAIASAAADVMVLDYLLPDGTAVQVWEYAQRKEPHLARRTVVLTGTMNETERRRLEVSLDLPVLAKPFESRLLVKVLRQLLRETPGK